MNSKSGISLLEILISMILLGLVVSGAYATYSLLGKGPTRIDNLQFQALNFARETLENLKNSVSEDPVNAAPLSAGTNRSDPLPNTPFKNLNGGTRTYDVADIDYNSDGVMDFKRVTVTVGWNE